VFFYLKNASMETTVWIDIIAINQHEDTCPEENEADVKAFESTIKICTLGTITVIDLETCNTATRAWCLYEWGRTIKHHGLEGLHLMGMSSEDRGVIVQQIDVSKAECFNVHDLVMIKEKIIEAQGSLAAFDIALKLQILLKPLSYSVDLAQLARRSEGTNWDFGVVQEWLNSDITISPISTQFSSVSPTADSSYFIETHQYLRRKISCSVCCGGNSAASSVSQPPSRVLCILAGAGTGKSTISAALLKNVLGRRIEGLPGEWEGVVTAYHFLKYSDARRLDPVAIVKSIAFQLALRLPDFAKALFEIDVIKVEKLTKAEDAFELLLGLLADFSSPIVILIDALDEADPANQQEASFDPSKHFVAPVANKALLLITACLAKLPPNVRFIFTARPETAHGELHAILRRAFGAVQYVGPHQLREGGQEGQVMVYDTIVKECHLSGVIKTPTSPHLTDVYTAYNIIFERCNPASRTIELLAVS